MTTEVILSTEDILVLGPPSQITVDLDLGAKGERGSRIFSYDEPDPAVGMSAIGQPAIPYDMYINLKRGDNYLTAYQYVFNGIGGYEWQSVFSFYPNELRKTYQLEFLNGVATKNINVTNITPDALFSNIGPENFSILYSIENQNPVASSIDSININPEHPTDFIEVTVVIKALEYKDNSWIPLGSDDEIGTNIGSRIVHLDIRVV